MKPETLPTIHPGGGGDWGGKWGAGSPSSLANCRLRSHPLFFPREAAGLRVSYAAVIPKTLAGNLVWLSPSSRGLGSVGRNRCWACARRPPRGPPLSAPPGRQHRPPGCMTLVGPFRSTDLGSTEWLPLKFLPGTKILPLLPGPQHHSGPKYGIKVNEPTHLGHGFPKAPPDPKPKSLEVFWAVGFISR